MAIGDSIVTVSEAVERYMAVSGQNTSSFKSEYMIRGLEIWKDIRNNVLKITSHKWSLVDKTKLPYRVKLPKCVSKFITVSAINKCGEYHNYVQDNNMHTVDYEESEDEKCSCDKSLAQCITTTESTEEIIEIDGVDYTKTVDTTISSNGDVYVKTIQPIQRLDAQGNPLYSEKKTFDFSLKMLIHLTAVDPTLYSDSAVPSDVDFHANNVGSDIHYFNGIYTGGVSHWGNDSIADMFRAQFFYTDVGVSGYSNRGINEIGGFVANTQEAYDNWRAQLEIHTAYELFEKAGVVVDSVVATHVGTVTTGSLITHTINLKITVPNTSPDLDSIMFNANADNEWNFTIGEPVEGSEWAYSNITETDADHKFNSVKTVLDPVAIVDMVTSEDLLCHLDVKECSCVEVSQENLAVIESCCKQETIKKCRNICQNSFVQPKEKSLTKSDVGYFKYDEATRTIYLKGDVPSQVLINYESTGEGAEDEMIPSYALMTFFMGMKWINTAFSKSANRLDKREDKKEYEGSKVTLGLSLPRNKMDITKWGDNSIGIFAEW